MKFIDTLRACLWSPACENVTHSALVAAVGKPCPYCTTPMQYRLHRRRKRRKPRHPTRDRIVSAKRGGTYAAGNVAIVCATCNNDKGHWSLPAFHAALAVENDPRAVHVATVIAERKANGLPV